MQIAVLGAGISGVSAAHALLKSPQVKRVVLFEARKRIGGRIHSLGSEGSQRPCIELGAEFVHGRHEDIFALARKAGSSPLKLSNAAAQHFTCTPSGLEKIPLVYPDIDAVLQSLDPSNTVESFGDVLAACSRLGPEAQERVGIYMRCYHGAPLEKLSQRFCLEEDSDNFNLAGPYGAIVAMLFAECQADPRFEYFASTLIRELRWSPRAVHLLAQDGKSWEASAAVLTVPLAKLRDANFLRFDPSLCELFSATRKIGWGYLEKLVISVKECFWPPEMTSLFTPASPFKLWNFNSSSGIIIAWCGGEDTAWTRGLSEDSIVDRGLSVLAACLQISRSQLAHYLAGVHFHSWINDQLACGSYTFLLPGGEDAAAKLRQPIEATLYFAGEATAPLQDTATVHGAYRSGLRAARQVLDSLAR